MYVYLDFLCAKAGDLLIAGVLGQQLFCVCVFFIIISSYILSANVQFSSSLFGGLACIAPTSRWCRSVAIPK